MKLIKLYVLVFVLGGILSCENPDEFLDVIPTGSTVPSTLEDVDNLLNNPDYIFNRMYNLAFMDPDVYMNEFTYSRLNEVQINAYSWISDMQPTNESTDNDYNNCYKFIYQSNYILSIIDDADLGSKGENDRANLKAEALAQRAMELFMAVTEYAPAYDPNDRDILGVPMPLEVDLQGEYGKSTLGTVYDQILSDLNRAVELANSSYPDINIQGNWRPGKASIYALLAEVHLNMGNFDQVIINANKALALYDFMHDWNTFDFTNPSNVFAGYTNDDYTYRDGNLEAYWNRFNSDSYAFSYSAATHQLYHPDFAALFDQVNDRRWVLRSSSVTPGGVDVSPNYYFWFPRTQVGLTVPRLLLTKAEAQVRTGDGAGAIATLNTYLPNRISNFTPLVHSDNATTLATVKIERRKELHGSGLNVIDLKRYHVYGDIIPTFTRTIPVTDDTVTLEPGDEDYYVKIPRQVRLLNPRLN